MTPNPVVVEFASNGVILVRKNWQHRWILLPDEGSPDVAPNPVFVEFASNGVILVRKNGLIAPFRAQGRYFT